MAWYNTVYLCKLCGEKVVDTIGSHGISDEDLGEELKHLKNFGDELKENRLLHTHINKSECFGLLLCIGFVKREGEDEK